MQCNHLYDCIDCFYSNYRNPNPMGVVVEDVKPTEDYQQQQEPKKFIGSGEDVCLY